MKNIPDYCRGCNLWLEAERDKRIINNKEGISMFALLSKCKIQGQMYYMLKAENTLLLTTKEHCIPMIEDLQLYSYVYKRSDKSKTIFEGAFDTLMITKKDIVVIQRCKEA